MKRLKPIAGERNIELILESFRPVTAEIDEVKLTLALSNLIENAIKYNQDDGWVRVSLNADHKYFYVKVADSGIGIPEESIEHILRDFIVWINRTLERLAEQGLDWRLREMRSLCTVEL